MNTFDKIKELSQDVYNFINNDLHTNLQEGRYEFADGCYANVEVYKTQEREKRKYENHREYIDIQMIIKGEEIIEISSIDKLECIEEYNAEKDISFYSNTVQGERSILGEGQFIIIYPGQAHMPCLQNGSASSVKKIVFKIPIERNKRLLFLDVDGTMTDGKIYMGEHGEICKAFNIHDGYGIKNILPIINCIPVIITARKSQIVDMRCKELGILEVYQGCEDKLLIMIQIANKYGIYENELGIYRGTAYMGDDIPDLKCMSVVEYKGTTLNAVQKIKDISDFIATKNGGDGAVREFIEHLQEVYK